MSIRFDVTQWRRSGHCARFVARLATRVAIARHRRSLSDQSVCCDPQFFEAIDGFEVRVLQDIW